MTEHQGIDPGESDLPAKLSQPARRALLGINCTRLEEVARFSEPEIKQLHGVGPNALKQLRQAFDERGLSFNQG